MLLAKPLTRALLLPFELALSFGWAPSFREFPASSSLPYSSKASLAGLAGPHVPSFSSLDLPAFFISAVHLMSGCLVLGFVIAAV
ncbi:hypothetical protein DM02DRAFT_83857 [Periconia macrospinosa]|uniref:Secreted protein n=1 Tax=Periconia macrospinosa TaxID=97972 RepID=A0A2V1E4N4_9PLEO|nr:hypothetical protein DM02DRAFT_83857 [Periconia macrospinosa]